MQNKIIIFVVSLVITLTSFMCVLYIEKRLLNPNGTEKVYVVKVDKIDKNQIIDEKNIDKLFQVQERRTEQVVSDAITNKEDLLKIYLKSDMYKNDIVSKDKIASIDDKLSKIENKREINVKSSDISTYVGGILREGDLVDLIVTYTKGSNVVTEVAIKSIYVGKAFSSDNSIIQRTDKTKITSSVNFIVSNEDACKVENALNQGKIKLVKVLDEPNDSEENIRIESQKK